MLKFLEEQLYEKTKDSQSSILFAQWNYDKQVIPTALHAVSTLFPHYSLHDESHSITILNNIVRIIGEDNIMKLSATDIWFILEASYSHDIGMVVTSQELIRSIDSDDFIAYFKELIADKKNSLHEFAIQFDIKDNKLQYQNKNFNLELHDGIKFILAEYFRRIHSDRSKDIITQTNDSLNLTSPRGVIPQRIFKILGDICSSHTKSFSDVMNLPFCEVGIDVEDAHPRFIACLLRIGDLLDLDNNRFSEVMLRTLSKIPVDTLNHKGKHLSIESFRVDREIIEVTANCKDYDTANVTQHWFNYLNSEISNQMIHWNNIVPSKKFGYLPTIGNLKVELESYDFIDGKNKPKFSVDTDKALELLQGAGLYEGAYQCIREILQNSVDATLIRIWLEKGRELDLSSPQVTDFVDISKEYPIKIMISDKQLQGDKKKWSIEISDRGTGISSHDLKFLMNTGSSGRNKDRLNIIDSMPIWMRPSGTFGIGFQSIFMLTDLVTIKTKSYFNEEFQVIELNSPNSQKNGDILIKRSKTDHSVKPGTNIHIIHHTEAIPSRYSIKGVHKNASRIARNYDPFTHDSLDIELGKVFDEIFDFAEKCPFPIRLSLDGREIQTRNSNSKQFDFYDDDSALELNVWAPEQDGHFRINTYFKNQRAENNFFGNIKFLAFEVNIHKDKASKVLTLNRNKIRSEYNNVLFEDIMKSSYQLITRNFDQLFKSPAEQAAASMFLNYYSEHECVQGYDVSSFNQWEKFSVQVADRTIDFKDLLNTIESLKLVYDKRAKLDLGDLYELDGDTLSITIRGDRPFFESTEFFLFKAKDYFSSILKTQNREKGISEVHFSKEKQTSPIPDDELFVILKKLRRGYFCSRAIIPCTEEFFRLRIKNNSHVSYIHHYHLDYNISIPYPKMLSPYVSNEDVEGKSTLSVELNEKLFQWVFDNRYDEEVTMEDIKESYDKMIVKFDLSELNKEENK